MNSRERAISFIYKLGFTRIGLVCMLLTFFLPLVPPFSKEHMVRWLIGAALIAAQAIAFDFTTGFINVVNFGFAAFVGLGAYTSALLVIRLDLSPWIGMFAGAAMSALFGLLTGVLILRLRGIYAAIMTWYVALAAAGLARNLVGLTRGSLGLNVPYLFNTPSNLPYYYLALVMLVVTYVVLRGITKSKIGLAFRAIGQNMEAARASGINPTKYRVLNFTVSCAFAGWLGGFYAHYIGILTPQAMQTVHTVEILAIAYIGGRGSVWGGAAVAFPFIVLMEWVRSTFANFPGLHLVIYGSLLIGVMLFYPGGFAAAYEQVFLVVNERVSRLRALVKPKHAPQPIEE